MGFEIPIDVDYFDHPKTLALIGAIGPEADIYPLRLWKWCALYAKEGVVSGGARQIEAAVKWTGDPGRLHKALKRAGFVDDDGKTVHNFTKRIGRAIFLYEVKKQKQRARYTAGILPEESGKNSGHNIPSHPIQDEISNPGKPIGPLAVQRAPRATFSKPSLEEIKAYCLERKNRVDPERFWNYYESNGWRVGKNAMKSWKAAVHTWEKNDVGTTGRQGANPLDGLAKFLESHSGNESS